MFQLTYSELKKLIFLKTELIIIKIDKTSLHSMKTAVSVSLDFKCIANQFAT